MVEQIFAGSSELQSSCNIDTGKITHAFNDLILPPRQSIEETEDPRSMPENGGKSVKRHVSKVFHEVTIRIVEDTHSRPASKICQTPFASPPSAISSNPPPKLVVEISQELVHSQAYVRHVTHEISSSEVRLIVTVE